MTLQRYEEDEKRGRLAIIDGRANGARVEEICAECGEPFLVVPNRHEKGLAKYCSLSCMGKNRRGKFIGPKNPRWVGGKVQFNCLECGKCFLTLQTLVNKGRGRYCSRECASVAFGKKHRGENHRLFKGGKTKKDGYIKVYVPNHPRADRSGHVLEHRIVMENHIGRPLLTTEHVHHKNGKKDDNRIENLVVVNRDNHYGRIVCPFCQGLFLIK